MDNMQTKQELFVKRLNGQPDLHKRPFTTLKVASIALLAGLIAGPMVFPKMARAQDAQQEQVQGQKLSVVQLDKPLAQLEKETAALTFNLRETPSRRASTETPVGYGITLITSEGTTFVVDVNDSGKWGFAVVFSAKNQHEDSTGDGTRGAYLSEFVNLVEKQTGRKLERVKIILDTGRTTYNGKEVPLTNAYLLPINSYGKVTTGLGGGKYLIYGVSSYATVVSSGPVIILEPNSQYTLSLASR